MTEQDLTTLLGFLVSGAFVGIVGSWVDQLLAYIRGH